MAWQALIVALVVAVAFAYSAWALMPKAWQHALLRRLGRPAAASRSVCGGCDACGPPAPNKMQVIRVHRR